MHPAEQDRYAERRRHRRVPIRARCWCEAEAITLYAQIVNVSEEGMFIRTFAPLKRGSSVSVRFVVGSGREIAAEALVVWARDSANAFGEPPGMGLKFVNIDDGSATSLRSYITSSNEVSVV